MDAREIVALMTLEEKASLLSGQDFWRTKGVERVGLPSVAVSDGPHGLRKQAENGDHLGINDSIPAVCFPAGCAMAASFDRSLAREVGDALGAACQHEGVAVVLGPAMNIKRSPLCGRNFEYYSEDPCLSGEMAAAMVKGVQGRGVGTSVKHFAANSQEHRRMSSDSHLDERTLREIYLPAFERVVKQAKPWTVMCSYNRINGVFASDNHWLLTELLRDEWGFQGLVVSDWGATNDRVVGVRAGMDLEMPASGGVNDRKIVEAVRSGKLDEADVDRCARRVAEMAIRYAENARPDTPWDMEAQHDLARRAAAECMVLLKNDQNLLPLSREDSIAVIGPFAKAPRYQGGGSSHINSFKVTSAWEEMSGLPGAAYAQGFRPSDEAADENLIREAEDAARAARVAVVFAGLPDAYESEGYDRTHMRLPACQDELIRRVARANPNTVVVLHNGSPVEMPWAGQVRAILEAYLGGQAVGGAAADVLLGEKSPSGRLPETFPLRLEDNPSYPWYGGEGDAATYPEGVFVGYRWYDKKKMDVLFPFGHGLGYTVFRYENLIVSETEIRDSQELLVSVDVTNVGKRAGKDVVQLYVAPEGGEVIRPVRELRGFEKVNLHPGETRTVRFALDRRAFAHWSAAAHDWRVESGKYRVQIGRSSRDIALEAEVRVTSTHRDDAPITLNTIFYDVMRREDAMAALKPLLDGMAASMGLGGGGGDQPAAISPEMLKAMLGYMPLRSLVTFSGGAISEAQVSAILHRINGESEA